MVNPASELYKFLWFCQLSKLDKTVLDCGAGGKNPPLRIFYENGFEATGIEIDKKALQAARDFASENDVRLNLLAGDMRHLNFPDNSFSFLYSYNSIFHLTKQETKQALKEFWRVVKLGGLVYVNLLSKEDFLYGRGILQRPGEFLQTEGEGKVIHTFFSEEEADSLFSAKKVVYKQKRIVERYAGKEKINQAFFDYIVKV